VSRKQEAEAAGGETSSGLTPLPVEQWSEEALTVLPQYLRRPELYLPVGPDVRPMPRALGLFAHHVKLGAAWMTFTEMLAGERATLDPRVRELAILRVAWRSGSNYEWKQHTRIGLASGLTTEQLYAIPDGANHPVWAPPDRAVLAAVDQMIDSSRIDAATWDDLAGVLDSAQLLELSFVIGGYLCFAAVANSVQLAADLPTEPVDAPELPAGP
jgi:alkylhydroperoxidase family enzyme